MQEGDRTAWYKAAFMTIGDIPLSFLQQATAAARKVCDHPAKIVPFICKYERDAVIWANQNLRHARARVKNLNAPIIEKHDPDYMTAVDLTELKAELVGHMMTALGVEVAPKRANYHVTDEDMEKVNAGNA